jgi:hypothetical protein
VTGFRDSVGTTEGTFVWGGGGLTRFDGQRRYAVRLPRTEERVPGWLRRRAEIAQAGVPAAGVVPTLDVLEDCLVRLGFGGPRLSVGNDIRCGAGEISDDRICGQGGCRIRGGGGARAFRCSAGPAGPLSAVQRRGVHLRGPGVRVVNPEPVGQIKHRRERGRCGGRPPVFDAGWYRQRNKRHYMFRPTADVASIRIRLRP